MVKKEKNLLFEVNDAIRSFPFTKKGCSFYWETKKIIHKDFSNKPLRYISNEESIGDVVFRLSPEKEFFSLRELNQVYSSFFEKISGLSGESLGSTSPFKTTFGNKGICRKIFHFYDLVGTLTRKISYTDTYEIKENCFSREDLRDLKLFQERVTTNGKIVSNVYRNIFIIPFLNKIDLKEGFEDWREERDYSRLKNQTFLVEDLKKRFSSDKNYKLFLESLNEK